MPGFIAIAPYFIWLRLRFSGFDRIVQNNGTETALVLIGLAVLLGLILDGFGSHIETGWDGCYPPQHVADWFLYLRHAFDVDPIGKGYIKFLVLKLKFELGLYCGI